jgi:probable HAF family extracellular repeat protein
MKSIVTFLITVGIAASSLAPPAIAQQQPSYTVTDLGTFPGGDNSSGYGINDAGWVTGCSNRAANGPQKAFLWYGYSPFGAYPLTDLGTLGGTASCANGPNASGEVLVVSTTSKTDPNGESFCPGLGPNLQCLAAVWKSGTLTALPTLPGGNNAKNFWLNNQGQVAGFSENGIMDPTCAPFTPSQVLRFEAVIWAPDGTIRELSPLAGDTVGFAWGINNKGQAVGTSGLCSNTSYPAANPAGPHAVLWEADGTPTDLGNLGGPSNAGVYNVATSINNRGQVVGFAQLPDGTQDGFLWTRETGMQDLGGFPGAIATGPPCCNTINDSGHVVGFSLDENFNSRAIVWQDKTPVDLNTLIPADSPWYLLAAESIDNAGKITGQALLKSACDGGTAGMAWLNNQGSCPVVHAFVATPR